MCFDDCCDSFIWPGLLFLSFHLHQTYDRIMRVVYMVQLGDWLSVGMENGMGFPGLTLITQRTSGKTVMQFSLKLHKHK